MTIINIHAGEQATLATDYSRIFTSVSELCAEAPSLSPGHRFCGASCISHGWGNHNAATRHSASPQSTTNGQAGEAVCHGMNRVG